MSTIAKKPNASSNGGRTTKAHLPGSRPGYKHTKLGWIPEDWEVKRYGEMTTLLTNGFVGTATTHYTESSDGVPYIQGYNVMEFGIDYHGMCKVTRAFHEKNSKSCLQTGDLLTIQTGDIGVTAAVPDNLAGANCHALVISRFREGEAFAAYYLQYLNSPTGRAMIRRIETGSTMKHINVGDLKREWVVKPTVEEQRRIAAVLGAWDRAIAIMQQLLAAQQQRKQGLMRELLSGKRRFPGFKGKWKKRSIGDIIEESRIPSTTSDADRRITVRLHLGGVEKREVRGTEAVDAGGYFIRRAGQFIYGKQNLHKGAMGIVPPELNGFESTQDIPAFDFLPGIEPRLFVHLMSRKAWYPQLEKFATGTGSKRIHPDHLFRVHVSIPESPEEQRRIANAIDTHDKDISATQSHLAHLTNQKRGLMQQLLTGAVRVKY